MDIFLPSIVGGILGALIGGIIAGVTAAICFYLYSWFL